MPTVATPRAGRRAPRLRAGMHGSPPPRPRSVLFVENSLGFGGSTVGLARLLSRLDRARFRPTVVVSHATQLEFLAEEGLDDVRMELLPMRAARPALSSGHGPALRPLLRLLDGPVATLDTWRRVSPYVRRLDELLDGETFDLVHLNNSVSANMGALRWARRRDIPCVLKQRGYEWPSRDVRRMLHDVAYFIPDSQAIADHLVELGADSDHMQPTYCTLDVDRYVSDEPRAAIREDLGLAPEVPVVGMAACIQHWKGQHVFVEAVERVRERFPELQAAIVGDTPDRREDDYLRGLRRQVERAGLADCVRFTGHRSDVERVLHAFDVFVHASVTPEPFGTVIAESMAAGTPVVAADAGGPREYVLPGRTGLLHTPGDADELSRAILAQLEDRPAALRMASAARDLVRERFGLADHVATTTEVYERVLAARSAAG